MKKKQKTAIIALAVGAVILSSAAIANFAASNGYSIYKQSIRKLFDQTNYTADMGITISVDGEELASERLIEQYDKASGAMMYKEISYDKTWEERPQRTYENYFQDGMNITRCSPDYNESSERYEENSIYEVHDIYLRDTPKGTFSIEQITGEEDSDEIFDKYFNFASSCADLLVGDIKNNFVLTGTENGFATYEATLDLFQIPEVVNSGADLIVTEVKKNMERRKLYETYDSSHDNDFDTYIAKLAQNPFISGAQCVFTVDEEGRLVNNVLSADVSGKDDDGVVHTLSVRISLAFSNYGTTVPEKIDIESSNVKKESEVMRARIEEIDVLLENPKLDSKDRERYESERKSIKNTLNNFEKYGPQKGYAYDFEEEEPEEADEENVAAIGGADGPTEITVTKQ